MISPNSAAQPNNNYGRKAAVLGRIRNGCFTQFVRRSGRSRPLGQVAILDTKQIAQGGVSPKGREFSSRNSLAWQRHSASSRELTATKNLILIHDSRQNVSRGSLHISESAAAEPLFEMPLQRTRAIEVDLTLDQGIPVCQIAQPYLGQGSEVGRHVEIDLEPRIDWTNVHLGRCTDQPPVTPARREAREDKLNRGAPGRKIFRMHLAMYVPHQVRRRRNWCGTIAGPTRPTCG